MIFPLLQDFADALAAMPREHPRYRILKLLDEAIRRDVHFIDRHPTTLFQCLWNNGWSYDCPDAAAYYEPPPGGWPAEGPPWKQSGPKLHELLESWRAGKQQKGAELCWVRSLRPPTPPLGSPQQAVLWGHEESVDSVMWSPDGRRIASGSKKTIRLWDSTSGAALAVLPREQARVVARIVWSPNGRQLADMSENAVLIWDAESGTRLAVLQGHDDLVMGVAYSPDGRRLVSRSRDRTVRVWHAEAGAQLLVLRGHERAVNDVAYSPDGRRIVSASDDQTLRIWEAESGAELAVLRGHESFVYCVAYSPDGRHVASGSSDRTVRVWDTESAAQLTLLRANAEVRHIAYSPHGRRLFSQETKADEWSVWVWDSVTGGRIPVKAGLKHRVADAAYSRDGRRIATASYDGTARLWDADSGNELAILRGHGEFVNTVAFSPDGRQLASGSFDKTVRIWDAEPRAAAPVVREHHGTVRTVVYSPDGGQIVSDAFDGRARLWDAESGAALTVLEASIGDIETVAFSPDGRRIVGGARKTVQLWDCQSGAELAVLQGHSDYVQIVAYSPDGRRIVSSAGDGTVRVWDAESGAQLLVLAQSSVSSLAFSADGKQLVAGGSWDNTVVVWDAETGTKLAVLRGHTHFVRCVAYSPDGRRVVSGSADKTVRVWNVEFGKPPSANRLASWFQWLRSGRSLEPGAQLAVFTGHQWGVERVIYSPDGRRIASVSSDKTLLWDAETFACLAIIPGKGDVTAVAAGAWLFPWRALVRGSETVIEDAVTSRVIARLPQALERIVSRPSSRQWAGFAGNHLYVIALEGQAGANDQVKAEADA